MDSQKLFLQTFLLVLSFTFSSSLDTITVNQPIEDGNLLISNENKFALGFFSPRNSKYRYLGIWYHNVPQQTVVWVANRNHPINGSSGILSVDKLGNLILYSNHNQKVPVWYTSVSVEVRGTCVAQLLDSGNLILIQVSSKKVIWQSFDHPTDTVLPGMKLGVNQNTGMFWFLTSWRSPEDPGIGNFSVKVNTIGTPQFFLYRGTVYYWRTTMWPMTSYGDVWTYSVINNQDEIYMAYTLTDASIIFRIVLDYSGVIKKLVWHEKIGKWKEFWKQQDSSSICGHREGFIKVAHVKLPDTSAAVWEGTNMSPMDCEKECRRNCSCSAYASIDIAGEGTGCLRWYGELMDTVNNMKDGYDINVRVGALELEIAQKSSGFPDGEDTLAVLIVFAISAWFIIIFFACLWLKKKKKIKGARNQWNERLLDAIGDACYKNTLLRNDVEGSMNPSAIAFFNLHTMLVATNNFSQANKLGEGGFGLVYKGELSNGQEIAVKRLSKNSDKGIEEFKTELMLIAKLQHKNLVKLLGCCIQGEEVMLVYEYLPNKSLDLFLFDATKSVVLDWRKRFDVIVGIARGILYLHQDSRLSIVHRDLKTSNILLDAEMNPKISDFGLARIFKSDQIQDKTERIVGTFGYMSPEYVVFGKFSAKSDIFSFGIILFEIITGRKNNSYCQESSSLSMIGHIWHSWRENRALEIVDSSIRESCPFDKVLRCIQIGLLCVQENVTDRPMMSTIILMLNCEITLPSPKQPAFNFRKS
ncbi:G-type lectin S-receptor-like serine/threonine-protein kinase At1g11410 isoform X2 [Manihot esculenta]|uniref:G-type lectin S-receptor-like serine/threonine-protein kinase At1g11410 isoform X2 n=1 Tax=Manihot esculenta TaxID=3983 RepID=UPI001CC695A7|nr:G-type lectin S-receptor-like serine/threonine-protein kinase At1g11410 isoform X2 [Manihot esculenta]